MKTENYEVIFAIVNAGFAEDVMDVAGPAVPEPEKRNDFYKKAPERVLFLRPELQTTEAKVKTHRTRHSERTQ